MNVHLIDGTFELFRAFYGAPSMKSPEGQEVGASRTFMRGLYHLLHSSEVTHVGVAFDTVIESFRNTLFDGYKTGEGLDPEIFAQFPLVEKAAEALGVVVWRMKKFEADDALAAAAKKFSASKRVDQVILGTPDKDLAQCVQGTRIVMWDRIREKTLDEKGVHLKFGVGPESIADLLALVGDTADGIPGLPGWGMKSASLILAQYKSVEKIPESPESWKVKIRGASRLSETLNGHTKEVTLYKRLATLRTDVPIPQSLDEMKWRGIVKRKLLNFCHTIGDERFAQRIEKENP